MYRIDEYFKQKATNYCVLGLVTRYGPQSVAQRTHWEK